jgi:hypothetical protein
MGKRIYNQLIIAIFTLNIFICSNSVNAANYSNYLSIITSSNPESNAVQSFVIIKEGEFLREGIKHSAIKRSIGLQTPFVIEYTKAIKSNVKLQWTIKATNIKHGTITLLSNFTGKGRLLYSGYKWKSEELDSSVKNRHRLVFRPKPFKHQTTIYKKGKNKHGKRSRYGGGTRKINQRKYNPQFAYDITLKLIRDKKAIFTHFAHIQMDRKDMIRQEYINHYNRKRYKHKERGSIPVPLRNEISNLPERSNNMDGNLLTESRYKLVINDGMLELVEKINRYYLISLKRYKARGGIIDLNKKRRKVYNNKLWLSSGWRNPERNEWYSNSVNGNHQRGGAVDLIIKAPANSLESSVGYWVLWKSLVKFKKSINGNWQLESNGVALPRKEYWQDIEPKNGIPDAFDKADHLHANVIY